MILFRYATTYYKAGMAGDNASLTKAIDIFLSFVEKYKDHELTGDALYWAADAATSLKDIDTSRDLLTRLLNNYLQSDMRD